VNHEDRTRAAEYLLGTLDASELEAFRRQLAEDDALRREIAVAGEDIVALAVGIGPVAPPPHLKARVLQSIGACNHEAGLGAIRAGEGRWRPSGVPGISFKKLYSDKASGLVTTLVRMEAGAVLPAHRHSLTEQCLILEGDLIHNDVVYGPGDFTWAEAGSLDPELRTGTGALLLIVGGH
jgi:anti-sigma factor ChrR (cupin superfamily)